MNKKNTIYLFKKYPKLFPAKDRKNLQGSLMGFGFSCGDGWFKLIDKLCKNIQDEINKGKLKQVVVVQVKEKFAGLRYYTSFGTDKIFKLINEAEEESSRTCEDCGKPGKLREDLNWYRTLCDSCYEKRKKIGR